ncbi:MAG: HEAT repeat domain-containing protein [Myxococcota bacterium]
MRDVEARRPDARLRAAERLAEPPSGEEGRARTALRQLAADPVGPVRAVAVEGLGHVGGAGAAEAVRNAFDDPDATVRQQAVLAAARLGDVEPVRRALEDPRPEMRFQAAGAFAALRPEEALPALRPLVADGDPEVRTAAVEAMGGLGTEARGSLAPALGDPSPEVRWAAAVALAELGDDRGAGVLRANLTDRDRVVDAAEALGRLGIREARDDLRALTRRWWISPLVRAAAAGALARMGDPLGERTLHRIVRAWRPDGRAYAARILADLEGSGQAG